MNTIRNPRAVLRLAKVWPRKLSAPVHVDDTQALMRAVSLLCNMPTRDGAPIGGRDMTPDQARDVVRHHLGA